MAKTCVMCVAVAMKVLSLTPADIGNLWSLTLNPHLARLGTSYSYISGFMLLAGLPFTLLVRTMTVSAAVLLCNNTQPGAGDCIVMLGLCFLRESSLIHIRC